jgi:hypothetical protein
LAGEQTEIKRIKEIMNKKEFVSSNDVNTIASLIKVCLANREGKGKRKKIAEARRGKKRESVESVS